MEGWYRRFMNLSQALFTTSNFGAYIAGAGKPNSPCTGGVISQ
ncbi:9539_t:CDS:1, partial [Paraglomus occultum]